MFLSIKAGWMEMVNVLPYIMVLHVYIPFDALIHISEDSRSLYLPYIYLSFTLHLSYIYLTFTLHSPYIYLTFTLHSFFAHFRSP